MKWHWKYVYNFSDTHCNAGNFMTHFYDTFFELNSENGGFKSAFWLWKWTILVAFFEFFMSFDENFMGVLQQHFIRFDEFFLWIVTKSLSMSKMKFNQIFWRFFDIDWSFFNECLDYSLLHNLFKALFDRLFKPSIKWKAKQKLL